MRWLLGIALLGLAGCRPSVFETPAAPPLAAADEPSLALASEPPEAVAVVQAGEVVTGRLGCFFEPPDEAWEQLTQEGGEWFLRVGYALRVATQAGIWVQPAELPAGPIALHLRLRARPAMTVGVEVKRPGGGWLKAGLAVDETWRDLVITPRDLHRFTAWTGAPEIVLCPVARHGEVDLAELAVQAEVRP